MAKPPVPKRVKVDKDVEVCGKYDLVDESLMVNKENGGVRDVIVRLAWGRQEKPIIHPDYAKDASAEVLLENKCCRFEPHVTVMRTTQKLVIHNTDPKGEQRQNRSAQEQRNQRDVAHRSQARAGVPDCGAPRPASAVRSIRGNWDG